jgi:hypothetical protein
VDFPYLAKMTKLNVAALASIASAPPPPEPKVEGGVSTDTTVTWTRPPGAIAYRIRWRRTDVNQWQESKLVTQVQCGGAEHTRFDVNAARGTMVSEWTFRPCKVVLPHIRVDDWVFGVSSVSKDGFESPVASAVPGGAFHPYIAPAKKP